LLNRTYFLAKYPTAPDTEAVSFTRFRPVFEYIEGRLKPKSAAPNLYTLAGNLAVSREKQPVITKVSLVNADMVLYQLAYVYDFSDDIYIHEWFPMLYVYANLHSYRQPLWSKMVSKRYCEKLFPLFDVTDIGQLKEIVEKSNPDRKLRYNGSLHSAVSIQQSIELAKIATKP
jgi:hypothetical protein